MLKKKMNRVQYFKIDCSLETEINKFFVGFSHMMQIFYLHKLNVTVFVILCVLKSLSICAVCKSTEIWPSVNDKQIDLSSSYNYYDKIVGL